MASLNSYYMYYLPILVILSIITTLLITYLTTMPFPSSSAASLVLGVFHLARPAISAIDADWYPPSQRIVNNLTEALEAEGVYGYIYDTSETPDEEYGVYNWCNMPHVRRREYVRAEEGYELRYVELVC